MLNMRDHLIRLIAIIGFFTATLFVFGCADNTTDPPSGKGEIKITMIDAPADYDAINIVVSRVEVHQSGADSSNGWIVINNTPSTYNLLELRNGASVILGDSVLDAGHYTQIRLILGTGSNIVVNGVTYNLDVASGTQTGIKLNHEFDIQSDVVYELTLDFNAERSIVLTGTGQYKLSPVIRLVPKVISGTISGLINPMNNGAFISIISGTDTVGTVQDTTTGSFKLMAIIQGTYDVRITSGNLIYNDTTITNVNVVATQNTDLGTINLSLK